MHEIFQNYNLKLFRLSAASFLANGGFASVLQASVGRPHHAAKPAACRERLSASIRAKNPRMNDLGH